MSYADIMQEYARQRGLRRLMIPVPFLTPRLSSLWLGLTTPLYARVGRALRVFPIRPMGLRQAIERAMLNEDREYAETRWSDAISSAGGPRSWGGIRFGTRLVDSRAVQVPVGPAAAFAPIRRIGGATGWYYGEWLWRLRGLLYRYGIYPLHARVFAAMLRGLAARAIEGEGTRPRDPSLAPPSASAEAGHG